MSEEQAPIKVVITGAGGQIGYSLVYMVASGYVFGNDQPIILHLLELPVALPALQGLCMELQDSDLPLVSDVVQTSDLAVAFKDVNAAFLVGAMPRKIGMERKDLLGANVKIFKSQGEALDKHAKKTVKVVVVGNPANTNAYMCAQYAPSIPRKNITAMTRLDQNRCHGMVADKLKLSVSAIRNAVIWGNHSVTMFPDLSNATIQTGGKSQPALDALNDNDWVKGKFVKDIQNRGKAVMEARKSSSAMSAAKAASDHMRDWWIGTEADRWVVMSVPSDGSYGIEKDLVFSFPCTVKNREWSIVQGIAMDDWSKSMIKATTEELLEEKQMANEACQ